MSDREWWSMARITWILALVLWLIGCAHAAPPIRVAVPVPILVRQDCEAVNVFEKCRADCLEHKPSEQAHGAIESATSYRCICGPFTP